MVDNETLEKVMEEVKRFLIRYDEYVFQDNHDWGASKANAALLRSSLDLSYALSELRRPESDAKINRKRLLERRVEAVKELGDGCTTCERQSYCSFRGVFNSARCGAFTKRSE